MYLKSLIPIIMLLIQSVALFGQKVEFTYDDNGNRLTRSLTVEKLQGKSNQLPNINRRSLNSIASESAKTKGSDIAISEKKVVTEDAAITANIYPNPTKGIIKIEISNMPLESKSELRLYNSAGTELRVIKNFESSFELDISSYKDGYFILRIKINDEIFNWKVIKSSI